MFGLFSGGSDPTSGQREADKIIIVGLMTFYLLINLIGIIRDLKRPQSCQTIFLSQIILYFACRESCWGIELENYCQSLSCSALDGSILLYFSLFPTHPLEDIKAFTVICQQKFNLFKSPDYLKSHQLHCHDSDCVFNQLHNDAVCECICAVSDSHLNLSGHFVFPLLSDGAVDQKQPRTKNSHVSRSRLWYPSEIAFTSCCPYLDLSSFS